MFCFRLACCALYASGIAVFYFLWFNPWRLLKNKEGAEAQILIRMGVALKLKDRKIGDLLIFARNIHDSMALNAALFTPTNPTLADFLTIITAADTAQQDTLQGGKPTRVIRDNAVEALENAMRQLGRYVDFISNGDESVINKAGMEAAKRGPRKYLTIDIPEGLSATITKVPGQMMLRWKRNSLVTNYQVEYCLDALTEDGWVTADYCRASQFVVKELPRGRKAFFRVRGFSAAGSSEWTQPVSEHVW
jgi:hypothetical protein